ncbi:MAG: carboxymuconolactone decarboxylase [Gammaproteobacteria bacterium]|nr:MAG: carboxymuconolactone decarboxylase [Gammaproteobacteria bacterium]RLA13688.1 MAG: carboxymuconolactone decarboxylase [Gammaproteobacteria bacterium]RLA18138.1 MAG: carboxymuconolactone decarboxylase [Gammaproteobacteria bacterium]
MSKAMDYLLQTRGEAMGSYFKFLKQAGSNLDPKTRALVSLLGKVHAQSESGLRQYLPRALRDGATAAEVIDVLLFSLPMLGLTRINWAIEIILEMNIPEFSPELLDREPEWHRLTAVDELPLDQPICLQVAGRAVFVLRDSEQIAVYDSRCPHQATNIPQQGLAGKTLTCPQHNWVFDLQTGDCVANGNRPLQRVVSRVIDRQVDVFF